jgi:hypothetical protein
MPDRLITPSQLATGISSSIANVQQLSRLCRLMASAQTG